MKRSEHKLPESIKNSWALFFSALSKFEKSRARAKQHCPIISKIWWFMFILLPAVDIEKKNLFECCFVCHGKNYLGCLNKGFFIKTHWPLEYLLGITLCNMFSASFVLFRQKHESFFRLYWSLSSLCVTPCHCCWWLVYFDCPRIVWFSSTECSCFYTENRS